MRTGLVVTFIGADRPGIVNEVSKLVVAHGANWEESHLAHLADRFAGIVLLSVEAGRAAELTDALHELSGAGLKVVVEPAALGQGTPSKLVELRVTGHDRPGIVEQVTRTIATKAVNIEELVTETTAAPMGGGELFRARALLRLPEGVDPEDVRTDLETLSHDLVVDLATDG